MLERGPERVLAAGVAHLEEGRARLGEHVLVHAVGAERGAAKGAGGACADWLFMLERGWCAIQPPAAASRSSSRAVRCTPCARIARAPTRPWRNSRSGTRPVGARRQSSTSARSSATWMWRLRLPCARPRARAGEASSESVKLAWPPIMPRRQACGPAVGSARSPAMPGVAGPRAVAVGGLVAQHRAQPHLLDRTPERRERAADEGRRGVMIDQQGGARERGLDRAGERREVDALLVERAVQLPPDLLEDLHEAARRRRRTRHASGERAVEVRVRVDETGQHEARPRGPGPPRPGGPAGGPAPGCGRRLDPQVGPSTPGVQRDDRRVAEQHGAVQF